MFFGLLLNNNKASEHEATVSHFRYQMTWPLTNENILRDDLANQNTS